MTKKRKIAYLAATATAIIWGAALPLAKPALSYITPHQFLFFRFLIAAILLSPILVYHLIKNRFPFKKLGIIILLELISMSLLYVIYLGLEKTAALQGSFILSTKPILLTLAGVFFLKEKEERNEIEGLVMAAIGTGLIIATPILFSKDLSSLGNFSLAGNTLITLAVFIETAYLISVKKFYDNINKFLIVSISTIIGVLYFYGISIASNTPPDFSSLLIPQVALACLYMGSLGTALAFAFQFMAYERIEASEATLFEYISPLVYIPLSVFWLKEQLIPTQLIGIVLISAGVIIAETRRRRKKTQLPIKLKPAIPALSQANDYT